MAESGGTSSLFRRATGGAAASVDNDRRALLDETPYEELGRDDGDTSPRRGGANLGTFMGVFSPVSVSMFSTLLFLRVGFIVGNLGLVGSFGALFLAYTLLLITVQSLCSIVTNGDVGGGGVYYMLSRCLGAEIGGTIGMVFYAANAVGSALYATGCAEGFIALFHMKPNSWEHYAIASLSNGFSLLICFVGAGAFGLASSGILVLILGVLGILVFNFSASSHPIFQPFNVTTVPHCHVNCTYHMVNGTFESLADLGWDGAVANLRDNSHSAAVYDCEDSAAYVSAKTAFAVLFSGVTGIMAGANLSGELRAPSKSIPYGTYSACAFTAAVYALLFVFTAATCNRDLLYHECHYLGEIAYVPTLRDVSLLHLTHPDLFQSSQHGGVPGCGGDDLLRRHQRPDRRKPASAGGGQGQPHPLLHGLPAPEEHRRREANPGLHRHVRHRARGAHGAFTEPGEEQFECAQVAKHIKYSTQFHFIQTDRPPVHHLLPPFLHLREPGLLPP